MAPVPNLHKVTKSGIRLHAGRVPVLVVVLTATALAGYMFSYGFAADDAMMSEGYDAMMSKGDAMVAPPAYARYDADSIDARVVSKVVETLRLYWNEGAAAFDMITPSECPRHGHHIPVHSGCGHP